ncbi:hypothetical protein [Nostoc sp.]|uniref:hypothetical protein n=1 Tax=Nostoc sp. TaxID=1180 RepID=UPI002FF5FA1E
MDTLVSTTSTKFLTSSQIEDLRLAASKMDGVERRDFQAAIAVKYCQGSARLTETVFGWGRQNIEVGLAEKRTGIICVGLQSAFSGAKRWEEKSIHLRHHHCDRWQNLMLNKTQHLKHASIYPVDSSRSTLTTQRTGI